ncbi:MAG: hypothetical protein ACRCV9_17935, partial [Burkholderiaceae bacterium]
MLTLHPLTAERLPSCAAQLCQEDQAELVAAGIDNFCQMMESALPDCAWAKEARWKNETIAIFGLVCAPGGEIGVPWMLTMEAMNDAERVTVARVAAREVRAMQQRFPALGNLVHAQHSSAINFIEWLGFHVERAPCGPGDQFYKFSWVR